MYIDLYMYVLVHKERTYRTCTYCGQVWSKFMNGDPASAVSNESAVDLNQPLIQTHFKDRITGDEYVLPQLDEELGHTYDMTVNVMVGTSLATSTSCRS